MSDYDYEEREYDDRDADMPVEFDEEAPLDYPSQTDYYSDDAPVIPVKHKR